MSAETRPKDALPKRCDECSFWFKLEDRNLGMCSNMLVVDALSILPRLAGTINATTPDQTCGALLMEYAGAQRRGGL